MPIELTEAALLAQLGWTPHSPNDLDELSENFLQYFLLCKNILTVAQYGGSYDI